MEIAQRDVNVIQDDDPKDKFPGVGGWRVFKDATKGKVGGCKG